MKQQIFFSFSLVLLFLHVTKTVVAQSSPAGAPSQPMVPAPPAQSPSVPITQPPAASPVHLPPLKAITNVTKILEKAGHFSIFIRLLKATQEDNHLTTLLNNSNNGVTIFVPSDSAFSGLKSGTLNTLNDDQKSKLIKFHEIPTFLSNAQFQTVSNPIATEAGSGGNVSMNVTSNANSVDISTGLTNTSISGTVYSDNQLAIYKVEKVLLPMDIFSSKAPTPAPAPAAAKEPKTKKSPDDVVVSPVASTATTTTTSSSGPPADVSAAGAAVQGQVEVVLLGFGALFASFFWL